MAASQGPGETHTVRVLFGVVLAEIIGFGILFPIIPLLLVEPESAFFILPAKYSIDTGYLLLGALIGLYPLGQFLATPVIGQLSDRYGRKRMMGVSIAGTVASSIIFGVGILTANIPLLFASRVVNGLTGGLVSVAQATIADVSPATDKSKNFGILGAAFGIGFIIGPFLGGVLSSPSIHPAFGPAFPFWVAAVLSTLSLFLMFRFLDETSPMEVEPITWTEPMKNVYRAWNMPQLRTLFGASFFYFMGFAFFTTFVSVFLIERFGFGQLEIGNFFLYIGVLVLIGQLGIVPKVYARFKEEGVLPITLLVTGAALLLMYVPRNLWVFLAIVPLFSFSNALTQVGLNTVVSNRAKETEQGLMLGINASLRSLGTFIPAFAAGILAAGVGPEIPVVVSGAIIVLTGIGYMLIEAYPGLLKD